MNLPNFELWEWGGVIYEARVLRTKSKRLNQVMQDLELECEIPDFRQCRADWALYLRRDSTEFDYRPVRAG